LVLLNAVQGVLSIILLIGLGYFLRYKGWFNDGTMKLFSRLVSNIALPAYMLSSILGSYDKNMLLEFKNGLIVPFVSIGTSYLIALGVAKAIKIAPNRFGTFCAMFALSNSVFVGLPVNLALFGEASTPFVLLYFFANTISFWTLGVYGISRDGDNKDSKLFSLENIKRIFSPPLNGIILAVLLVMLDIKLPAFLMSSIGYVGNMTRAISMMFIGMVIYTVDLRKIRLKKDVIALLSGRFVVGPTVVALLYGFLPVINSMGGGVVLPSLMKKVFVIQSSLPVMTQTSIIAEANNADPQYAAVMTSLTTFVSLLMIPVYMVLVSRFIV
jgi:predicted permease